MNINLSFASDFLPADYLTGRADALAKAHEMLREGNGPGGDYTGWVKLPVDYDKDEFARIQAAAQRIRQQSDILVVIGIGGSYLGARAVIDLLGAAPDAPEICFAGNGLSTDAMTTRMSDC